MIKTRKAGLKIFAKPRKSYRF